MKEKEGRTTNWRVEDIGGKKTKEEKQEGKEEMKKVE